jgi:hypothetical protein
MRDLSLQRFDRCQKAQMEDSNPVLPPAARRALAEAAARRAEEAAEARSVAPEIGGPDGPEPTRYGDWERKGIASDF